LTAALWTKKHNSPTLSTATIDFSAAVIDSHLNFLILISQIVYTKLLNTVYICPS
jgi:hypothetical protein